VSKTTQSSLSFWSVAVIAAAFALVSSVQLGKAIGAEMLRHGVGKPAAEPPPISARVDEVVGGQPFKPGSPGQPEAY